MDKKYVKKLPNPNTSDFEILVTHFQIKKYT